MTALANEYQISRTFLYQLLAQAYWYLNILVCVENREQENAYSAEHLMVLLRLEGHCSISSISDILQYMGFSPCSTGTISERLKHYGQQLPHTLKSSEAHQVVYLSDEIFALSSPILITIEPKSTAILKIELAKDRTADTWGQHFEVLKQNQYKANALSSDRGKGIVAGFHQVHPDLDWFSDHFHEFRELTKICTQLEKKAYSAIQEEAECVQKFYHACSESHLQKRLNAYEIATQQCQVLINQYDTVNEVCQWIRQALYFFDKNGQPQQQMEVIQELLHLFSLLLELDYPPILQAIITLTNHLDEITHYFKQVNHIWNTLSLSISSEVLPFICLAWQCQHFSYQTKSNTKRFYINERDFLLECSQSFLEDSSDDIIQQAFQQLDFIVRSSSLIEMVNSLIRPYLNSCKGQITQEALNLIMFYHNHRRYKSGRRKNNSPIELLTSKKIDTYWLDLLLDSVT
jgi:hypothetical protein